ncbi:hypothetical protein CWD94_17515 [Lysinibacillus xylanilyticus]|uniref:Uncharacterized protein n=1 Tax=Lysinibacillus xylanilyticus TaxID=582475 RepID=A0A2M9Q318_9BACI|nr:hypothetical protein CWD94_17515 [Lysinibacillus xylanilyticus]
MTPWGLANRGTKAKTITSCDNAFVTNIGAAAATLALRFRAKNICWPETLERSGCFRCESAQSERKSTPRYGDKPNKS